LHRPLCLSIRKKEDSDTKEYIRMRDAHKRALKTVKQQIMAFCLRYDFRYTGKSNWTMKHLAWLKSLEMDVLMREVLDEYLQTY